MKRRKFLRNSIAFSVLSLGGISAFQFYQQSLLKEPTENDYSYQFLNQQDRILLEVLIPVFVANMEPSEKSSIESVLHNIDNAIIHLSVITRSELRELFDLLNSAFGRTVFASVWLNWQSASSQSVSLFLTEWRNSQLDLLEIAYKGLHKIIIGSYFAEENTWQNIGYSGPPIVAAAYPLNIISAAEKVED